MRHLLYHLLTNPDGGYNQDGIGKRIGGAQGSISKNLAQLRSQGLVTGDRKHIRPTRKLLEWAERYDRSIIENLRPLGKTKRL